MHRFLWDFHYTPVPGVTPQYPIAAVYKNTAPEATSPWAMPGNYTVVLTIDGKKYEQPLRLVMDPRVKTSLTDLGEQLSLSKQLYDQWLMLNSIAAEIRRVRGQLTEMRPRVSDATLKTHVDALADKLQALAGGAGGGFGGGGAAPARATISSTTGRVRTLFNLIEEVDVAPTPQVASAVPDVVKDAQGLEESWRAISAQDIPALDRELKAAGLPGIMK
jgi:hypothetical protein